MTNVRFRVLGPVEAADTRGAPVRLGGARLTLLTLLLADAGRVVSLDRIVEAIWNGEPPPSATGVVVAHVSHLRRLLDPDRVGRTEDGCVLTRAPGYLLRAEPGELDTELFARRVAEGEQALDQGAPDVALTVLEEALALWRGDPFTGVELGPELAVRADALADLRLRALEGRVRALLDCRRTAEAVTEAEALVRRDPLRERFWALLIRAGYLDGRQADALAAYAECRRTLDEELGLEPGQELQDLHLAVLRRDPALDTPAASPALAPIIGRERELAAIHDAVGSAVRGSGRMVLLEGEAGIGKTTVAESAVMAARAAGVRTVWARTVEDLGAPALWLWEQVLRDLGQSLPAGPDVPADPALARFRLLESVTSALTDAARDQPLLLVLEDLHWADAGSLQALRLLAGRLPTARCAVVATSRTSDALDPAALEDTLTALGRERAVRRMPLLPFSLAEVKEFMAERLVGDGFDAGSLRGRTGGNPFYLTELVLLLSGGADGPVPATVRDVVERRFGRLPVQTRRALRLAALAGTELDPRVLAHAVGAEVTPVLEPALQAGLLHYDPDDWSWRFTHDITRDALASALSPLHRAELHGLLADGVAAVYGDRHPDELARHRFHAARGTVSEPAFLACTAAADTARRRLAPDQAARHRERALATLPAGDDRRFETLIALTEERRLSGDLTGANASREQALALALAEGDTGRATRAAAILGGATLWNWRYYGVVDPATVALLRDLLSRTGEPRRRAELLGTLATELYYGPDRAEGERHALEALELARPLGDPVLLSKILNNYAIAAWTPDGDERRLAALDESLALTGRGLPLATEAINRMHRLSLHLRHQRMDAFRDDLRHCVDLAPTLGIPELEIQTVYQRAVQAGLQGDWEIAAELSAEACTRHRRTSLWGAQFAGLIQRVAFALARGRTTDLAGLADELVALASSPEHVALRPTAVRVLTELDEHTHARALLERWGLEEIPRRRDWLWDYHLAELGAVSAVLGAPDPAAVYAALLPLSGQYVVMGTAMSCLGSYHLVLASLARSLGRPGVADGHLAAADRIPRLPGLDRFRAAAERE
ncbi:BTAD domain-containing putative transcriptional regulator [Actinocorallia longicatena]|uniref:BTAD domain-containing putative transcriptional regulator n=1 Tax=Actinocorallia longicatena TaxID=111803 RepID=A0ABP6QJQ6_9ACTN